MIYRYTRTGVYLGSLTSPVSNMMDLWGLKDNTFLTATNDAVTRAGPYPSQSSAVIWTTRLGTSVNGVSSAGGKVYAVPSNGAIVYILDLQTGDRVDTKTLSAGGRLNIDFNNIWGGLVAINDKV